MDKCHKHGFWTFCFIYVVLLFFSGFFFYETQTALGQIIIISLLLLLWGIDRSYLNNQGLLYFALLSLNIVATNLFTGIVFKLLVLCILILFESFVFVSFISVEQFRKAYVSCMTVIAVVSLIANALLIYYPEIIALFPKLVNTKGSEANFIGFSIVRDLSYTGSYRNQGLFWEPGAYQFFLALAYILELYDRNKISFIKLAIFIISMVTTVSTTGIIICGLLVFYTICFYPSKKLSSGVRIMVVTLLGISALLAILPKLQGFIRYTLIVKIEQLLNYQPGIETEASSRMDSIYYVLKELTHSPILGIGMAGYDKLAVVVGHRMFTCTPINIFANFGLFFGCIVYWGLYRFFKSLTGKTVQALIIMGILCLSMISEELSTHLLIYILFFYGIVGNSNFVCNNSLLIYNNQ